MQTAQEMRTRIIDKAVNDPDYRARLLDDANAAVGEELGVSVPDTLTIHVHEEQATDAHLVLPPSSRLSEADLGTAAGGSRSDWDPSDTDWSALRLW